MEKSILKSIKDFVGVSEGDKVYDDEIIMYINSSFFILNQLQIGPKEIFSIENDASNWDTFLIDNTKDFQAAILFVKLKVKWLFDPPQSQAVLSALERQISEIESRLNLQAEGSNEYEQTQ